MHFLITGITGLRNCGVDALLTTVVAGLRRRWPDCQIDVLTYDEPFDSRRGYDVEFHANKYRDRGDRPLHRIARQLLPRQRNDAANMHRLIARADAVIASGGDVFSSDYAGLGRHLMPVDVARQCGVPYFFLGHSIGRFRSQTDADAWLESARGSAGVSIRESASYRYVVDDLRLTGVPVVQAADTAFLLEPTLPEHVQAMRRVYGLEEGRPCVACGVSQGIAHFGRHDERQHIESWKSLIRHILESTDCQVLLVPHVLERSVTSDDRLLASRLVRELEYCPGLHVAAAEHTSAEFKGLIATCDFVVSERMHAAIAGLSSAVPTLAVGYSIKAEGIIDDCYGEADASSRPLIDIQGFLDPGAAAAAFDKHWQQRETLAGRLTASLPAIRVKAEANFEALAHALATRAAR